MTAQTIGGVHFPLKHLALGLIIRELLAPWTGHPYDFEIWARLGFYMQTLGNPYRSLSYVPGLSFAPSATTGSISYPPLSAFIFAITYKLYSVLGEPSRFLYYFLLKQPMVLADVGVAVILAKVILLTGDTRSARTAFLLWLYFPLGIVISSVWGQLDPLALFLVLLAIYYFLGSRWLSSAVILGFSIYLKTLPVVFLPVFLMQNRLDGKSRVSFALVSLVVPILGTLLPAILFNWGLQGIYNNFSFQVVIPSTGAMSALGYLYLVPYLPGFTHYFTGSIWISALLVTYFYIYKRALPLVQGLLLAIFVFSISRPFLPEQWSIYPLGLLLLVQNKENLHHFLGLAVTSTAFLVANNTFLVRFFSPLSTDAFNWDVFINNQSPFVLFRVTAMGILALLYFTEAFMVVLGRESFIHRTLFSSGPAWLHKPQVATPGVGLTRE